MYPRSAGPPSGPTGVLTLLAKVSDWRSNALPVPRQPTDEIVHDEAPATRSRIGYLTSQYPATSHTFILREVAALRAQGVHVDTFSVRPASDDERTDSAIAAESASTFVILSQGVAHIIAANARMLLSRPGRYLGGFVQAMRHRPPGIRGMALAVAHFAEAATLADKLRQGRITHLHNHFANSAATVGLRAANMLDLPWSFMIHGISETDYPANTLRRKSAALSSPGRWFGRACDARSRARAWTRLESCGGVPRAMSRWERRDRADDRMCRRLRGKGA